jgi:predicted small integral membrane protein
MRSMKIVAAGFIGLIGLLAFLNNLANLGTAHAVVSAVVIAPEQPYYKIMGPTVGSAWLAWVALFTIMAGELAAGVVGFFGAFRLLKSRAEDPAGFQKAKRCAIVAGAIGMFVWYGFFIVIGEMYFNMWQTEIGLGSVEGAFRYGSVCAALTFFIALRDD